MVQCEFPISAPGLIHASTLLIGLVCATLGFMTHLHASWISNKDYKVCESADKYWKTATEVDCPDISLETAFLIMVVICLVSSMMWYYCELCCLGGSKSAALFYVLYLLLAAVALVIAGVLYIKSAILISRLPSPDYMPVVQNIGRVLIAAVKSDKPDDMKLTAQSDEQTYYQEKIATGCLTIINGLLHVICAWLAVVDLRK